MFGRPDDWGAVGQEFSSEWNVLIPRLPVFDFPSGQCGLETLCGIVQQIMDENRLERVILGGNSLGGHLAVLTALAVPERVAGMVLTGSSGLFERGLENGFERGVPRKPDRDWLYSRVREVFFDPVHITDELLDEVSETISDRRTVLNIVKLARSVRRSNLRSELSRIKCPVTLIWGNDDQITPPEVGHDFARHLPESDLHFIAQCGHTPPIERPEEFNRIFRKSLERMVV